MKPFLLLIAAALAGAAHAQSNCDGLRAEIEAKISAAGVTRFSVEVVDAAAPAEGQVVGSCERGAKKIVYRREVDSNAPPRTGAGAPGDDILTECRDGTVIRGGNCKP